MKHPVVLDALALLGLALLGVGLYKLSPVLLLIIAGATLFALSLGLASRAVRAEKEGN